jgi:tRNA threonylcarbamoyladenosine modification (KEOPS) complex Cgi121 subunit
VKPRGGLQTGLYRVLVRDAKQRQVSDPIDLGVADGETRTLDLLTR